MDYLFKLSDAITPTILASAAILPSQPRIIEGEGEDGIAHFCQVSDLDIPKIKGWLATTYPMDHPVFAPIRGAQGFVSPLCHVPTRNQYPVWYFFYGTLANSSFLSELFGSSGDVPVLTPAVIHGGKLRTWDGKYNALVDGDSPASRVDGFAYKVVSQKQEDALRMYETAKYEVVRVDIELDVSVVKGFV
ncbi:hypothetical protein G6011_04262 [Alternaria panax]|uniref:Putative gamma-glutamylcyclotransferase n=1 Tax=Alternaria panax TaxID=48097 RepID=A0AAD4NTR0_9PLEO|nr:hypothetical protein G6011_04262 [Alternaria panax]